MPGHGLGSKLRLGYIVFGALIAIKIGEYLVATAIRTGAWPYLLILALVGAWPILYYLMHISKIWRSGSEDDD